MPSVDLRPLLPASHPNQRSTDPQVDGKPADLSTPSPGSRIRLTGPQLANLIFVFAACVGALFSAAYLFKGDELLHEVAAWPRELFSGRPAVLTPTLTETENADPLASIIPLPGQSSAPENHSGDPFSSSRKLLGLDSAQPPATARPNLRGASPFSSAARPLTGLSTAPTGSDALSSNLLSGVTAVPPQGSAGPAAPTANSLTAATASAPATAATAGQTAVSSATNTTSRVSRAANHIGSSAKTANVRGANQGATLRGARPSAFKNAMTAIARSLRGSNAVKSKVGQTKSSRAQTNGRATGAHRTRLANYRSNETRRQTKVAGRALRSARAGSPKSSIRGANSRKPQSFFFRLGTRSAIPSRSTATMSSGFSRGGSSSIGTSAPSGFSSSAGGIRSLGSMGTGHGFGGGGRMGMGGGHGFGRGR